MGSVFILRHGHSIMYMYNIIVGTIYYNTLTCILNLMKYIQQKCIINFNLNSTVGKN